MKWINFGFKSTWKKTGQKLAINTILHFTVFFKLKIKRRLIKNNFNFHFFLFHSCQRKYTTIWSELTKINLQTTLFTCWLLYLKKSHWLPEAHERKLSCKPVPTLENLNCFILPNCWRFKVDNSQSWGGPKNILRYTSRNWNSFL